MDVRTLCLAALSRGEATGYEIKKMFEQGPFAHLQRASFGSIYPALSRLLDDGLVEAEEREQSGRPDKKVYRLTPDGDAAFREALTVAPEPDSMRSDLLFMLFFAAAMPTERVRQLVDERIEFLRDKVAMLERKLTLGEGECDCPIPGGPPGPEFVLGYGLAMYRTAADYLEQNRDGFVRRHAEWMSKASPTTLPPSPSPHDSRRPEAAE